MSKPRQPGAQAREYAHYDQRGYRTLSVEAGYARWSLKYDGSITGHFDTDLLERSEVVKAMLPGAKVIDLGCGTGRIGVWLEGQGAAVVHGVDRTEEMLAHARPKGVYGGFTLADMTATGLEGGAWDGVTTSLAVCHVASLRGFYREVARLLRPGGFLALIDFHPFFLYSGIPSHFTDVETGEDVAVENYVHPFSAHHREAYAAGLAWRELEERFVDPAWVELKPAYGRFEGMPITFLITCVKGG